jgi:hypothetical protein
MRKRKPSPGDAEDVGAVNAWRKEMNRGRSTNASL